MAEISRTTGASGRLGRLPQLLYNFGHQNEDASVEVEVAQTLAERLGRPLRVLSVASCGTNALTLAALEQVEYVDAVDIAPAQLRLSELIRGACVHAPSAEALARFIDGSGERADRAALLDQLLPDLVPETRAFWAEHRATVETGLLPCAGTQRCCALLWDLLPTTDPVALAEAPEIVAAGLRDAWTHEALVTQMIMPPDAMESFVRFAVPAIAEKLNRRLAELREGADPDFVVQVILEGTFPLEPVTSRPLFLRPDVLASIRARGCHPDRIRFHAGPIQVVGPELGAARGRYDLVDLSNILDMDVPEAAPGIVAALIDAVAPGGAVLCRWEKQPGFLRDTFTGCGLQVDEAMSQSAEAAESSCFMTEVCIGLA